LVSGLKKFQEMLNLVFELILGGLYLWNPEAPGLIGALIYVTHYPVLIDTIVAFPISVHWIGQDLKKGIQPMYGKLLDLEITRWLLVLFLNFFEIYPMVVRPALASYCLALVVRKIGQHLRLRHTHFWVLLLNVLSLMAAVHKFYLDLSQLGIYTIIAVLNHYIHWELLAVK